MSYNVKTVHAYADLPPDLRQDGDVDVTPMSYIYIEIDGKPARAYHDGGVADFFGDFWWVEEQMRVAYALGVEDGKKNALEKADKLASTKEKER